MAIAEDASTPAVATVSASTSASTLASASFSPPSATWVVVEVAVSYGANLGSAPTLSISDNQSGTWTSGPVQVENSATTGSCNGVAFFTRFLASGATGLVVTGHTSVAGTASIKVDIVVAARVLTGAAASQTGAASAHTGATTAATTFESSITTTAVGSRVYVGSSSGAQGTYTPSTKTTTIDAVQETTTSNVCAVGKQTTDTTTPGATTLGWTGTSGSWAWAALEILEATAVTHSGAASLSGSGSMTAAATVTAPGTANLAGSGAMTAAWEFEETAALDGEGNMTAAGSAGSSATMTGTGSMTAAAATTFEQSAALAGSGSMSLSPTGTVITAVSLDGEGQFGLNLTLKLLVGLTGVGSMSIPQVAGGLVNGVGGVGFPYALPGSSQVAVAPPGSTSWQWLGTLGQVTALTYSYVCPGGADKMTCTVMVPAAYRTQLFNPGWQVKITRGGHDVWHGKLDEPVPTASGWTLTAVGQGNRGQDFLAIYSSTWPASQPDQSINNAISRGMPWVNPGVGTPSGAWYGQAVDSGAQTVTALLNLICTRGALTWYVNSQPGGQPGDDLSVFPLPTTVNRLLVVTTPTPRTLGGDINTIFIKYEVSADNTTTGATAVYTTTSVQNAASVAAHGVIETYIDLSDVGVQTAAAAQAVGNKVLQVYQRASFAGPFTAAYGQLLNAGGAPIDPGTDQAGTVCRLILTDYGYGGEVTPQFPVTFCVGAYEWDDFAQVATITPYQAVDSSLTGLLSMENTVLTPITVAST